MRNPARKKNSRGVNSVHTEREDDRRRRAAAVASRRHRRRRRRAANLTPPEMSTYLIVGGLYIDHIHTVESYPEEDTAIPRRPRRRGGNAATSAVVLSQLLGGARGDVVRLMCAAPVSDPDTAFALASLAHEAGVDASLREEFDGVGQPAAFITVSRSTGSRTIISSRTAAELTSAHCARAGASPTARRRWRGCILRRASRKASRRWRRRCERGRRRRRAR